MEKIIFGDTLTVFADKELCFEELSTLTFGFCGKNINCEIKPGEDNTIKIGDAAIIDLSYGDEYTLNITETGVAIKAKDKNCLMRGYMSFLMSIIAEVPTDSKLHYSAGCALHHGQFVTENRMVHICVFPETTFFMFRKLVRLCAVLQYTHIIIEFWGTLKFDCLKELSWKSGFEKSDVKKVLSEAKALGLTPVPMFNHFGHAAGSRAMNGKHVVLDQNPSLEYLFTPDGWAWNIECKETVALLSKIRSELYGLFEGCEYIHLGCDEAYIYGNGLVKQEIVADFFKRITTECVNEGKTPILWGDMFICKKELTSDASYECNAKSVENAEMIRSKLHKNTIIADWHYEVFESPWQSSEIFRKAGFKTMCCPWYKAADISAAANTVKALDLFGIIQTTWHSLSEKMPILYMSASKLGMFIPEIQKHSPPAMAVATIIRKITFEEGKYEDFGFGLYQTGQDYRNNV